MDSFDYEHSLIRQAMQRIARLRQQQAATTDPAVRSGLEFEISEKQRFVHLMRSHIGREQHRGSMQPRNG
jgi:hypothetical protein